MNKPFALKTLAQGNFLFQDLRRGRVKVEKIILIKSSESI